MITEGYFYGNYSQDDGSLMMSIQDDSNYRKGYSELEAVCCAAFQRISALE